jgi:hypothetical protein
MTTEDARLLKWTCERLRHDASWDRRCGEAAALITSMSGRIERLEAVERAARKMPRKTPAPGGCSTVHMIGIEASAIWALDTALDGLADAQPREHEAEREAIRREAMEAVERLLTNAAAEHDECGRFGLAAAKFIEPLLPAIRSLSNEPPMVEMGEGK